MTKTTMSNATINSIKSTCNPREIYNMNRVICTDGIHPDDMKAYFRKSDGMLKKVPYVSMCEREKIVDLLKAGYTVQKICEITHRTHTTINKIKREEGMTKPRKKSDKYNKLIISMYLHGYTPKEIVEELKEFKVNPIEVYHIINKNDSTQAI